MKKRDQSSVIRH